MRILLTSAVAAVFMPAHTGIALDVYEITWLGELPGQTGSTASAINELGQVVGRSGTHGFVWDAGVITDLGTLPGGTSSWATDINDQGVVSGHGSSTDPGCVNSNCTRAFTWTPQTGLVNLGTLPITSTEPDNRSLAHAINNNDQVVGRAGGSFGSTFTLQHGFLYDNGTWTDLGGLPLALGVHTRASDINDAGQIVGTSSKDGSGSSVRRAIVWENGVLTELPDLPGTSGRSSANSINSVGQIVGVTDDEQRATLWHNNSVTELHGLPGETGARPNAINDTGQVVGFSKSDDVIGFNVTPVLWENTVVHELSSHIVSPSNGRIFSVEDINNAGQIVGFGTGPSGETEAFILTPTNLTNQTIKHQASFSFSLAPGGTSIELPKFDPNLGDLLAVEITIGARQEVEGTVEIVEVFSGGTFELNGMLVASIADLGLVTTAETNVRGPGIFYSSTGTKNFGPFGAEGIAVSSLLSEANDLSALIGLGTFQVDLTGDGTPGGFDGLVHDFTNHLAYGNVEVKYFFTPAATAAVPEPSTLTLLSLACFAFCLPRVDRRRR